MNSRYWRRARRLTVSERRLLLRHGRSLAAVALFHALLVVALWLWGTLDTGGLYVSLLLGALAVITVVYLLL
ncbi:MAG TPA: GGDEF domain-containing protein, partial [Alcanivorax sp.]|nr:GGDEF domain-containing protein [Alcanivorax sp.]